MLNEDVSMLSGRKKNTWIMIWFMEVSQIRIWKDRIPPDLCCLHCHEKHSSESRTSKMECECSKNVNVQQGCCHASSTAASLIPPAYFKTASGANVTKFYESERHHVYFVSCIHQMCYLPITWISIMSQVSSSSCCIMNFFCFSFWSQLEIDLSVLQIWQMPKRPMLFIHDAILT